MSNSSGSKFLVHGRETYRNFHEMLENTANSEFSENDSENENSSEEERLNHSTHNTSCSEPLLDNSNALNVKFILAIMSAIAIALYTSFLNSDVKKASGTIDNLKEIFPNQPNHTFDDFETIIDEIVFEKAVHPAVFLFLYNTNENNKVDKLVHHLANYASEKLNTNEYISVPKRDFLIEEAKNDYGYLINKYKSDLVQKKVMVVKNLQNIPAETAQVFHSFCDEISPLVERVVYIFTLKVDSLVGQEEKIAENNLKRVWKELDTDILMPLITRITSTVLKILM